MRNDLVYPPAPRARTIGMCSLDARNRDRPRQSLKEAQMWTEHNFVGCAQWDTPAKPLEGKTIDLEGALLECAR